MTRLPEALVYLDEGEIVVDSFAGGGGASKGVELALGRGPDIAINHDAEAIALHKANHPETTHYPEDVWQVDPVKVCRGRPVGLMWLSPDCKHFSKAKGGKPVSPRVRGLAWVAVRWAKAVKPRIIVLENVEEFQTWGPVDRDTGRPFPRRGGITFKRFIGRLRTLGYVVEWRELRACDYGAPTIRKRLFLVARCDGQPIAWPTPTHGKGRALPWRTAAECIDFGLPCPSIFGRKKPLAANTLRRIGAGLRRFVFEADRPFIVPVTHHGDSRAHALSEPLRTITGAHRGEQALVAPSIIKYRSAKREGDNRVGELSTPPPTQDTSNRFALVEPFLVPMQHQNRPTSPEEPVQTVTTQGNKFNLVAPLLVPRYGEDPDPRRGGGEGQAPRAQSVEKPLSTIVPTGNGASLVAGFLAKHYGGHETPGTQLDLPISTLTTQDHHHLVTAHIKRDFGQSVGHAADAPMGTVTPDGGGHCALLTSSLVNLRGTEPTHLHGDSIEEPARTVSAGGNHAAVVASSLVKLSQNSTGQPIEEPLHTVMPGAIRFAEVRAFLVAYYGTAKDGGSLFDPMRTVTPQDRFGLVTVDGQAYQLADIGMRMLAPRELYRAQGFPDSYKIDVEFNGKPMTKTAQVRMCGNSVCPDVAAAIIRANVRRVGAGEHAA